MASQPRYALLEDGSLFHVTWKCHNESWLLETNWAKQLYYNLLLTYKNRYGVEIYSYCFMDNHPHLSGKLKDLKSFSDFFRVVNSRFARVYNATVKRRGQVVMDRFKSPRIKTEADLLKVMLYIDFNPKRAGKVNNPRENEWSSLAYYAYGTKDPLITPAPAYLELAVTEERRQECYQAMVAKILQNDWKEKKPYSSANFIGDPHWVIQKNQELMSCNRELKTQSKQRYRERFAQAP